MDKIFSSRPGRTRFLWTVSILSVLLLTIRFGIFPNQHLSTGVNDNIISFIEKFVTSIFTAVMVGFFLYWIQGSEKKMEITFTSSGSEIETALSLARKETKIWHFNGGLGRYTRISTMPELSKLARKSNGTIILKLVVMNPFNNVLLQEYCDFRLTFEEGGKSNKWCLEEAQAEICATIIQCVILSKNKLLDIKIATKNYFTLSRMDISSNFAIVTRENPTIPSQILKNDSHLYKLYTEEFNHTYRHSKELDIRKISFTKLVPEEIMKYLTQLFPSEQQITAELASKVIEKINKPKNPF